MGIDATFLRNVKVAFGGTFIAQVIPVIASPILTRLYSPAEFGQLAVYMSLIAVAGAFTTLRYEQAILLPRYKGQAGAVVGASLAVTLAATLVALVAVHVPSSLLTTIGADVLRSSGMLYVLPLSLALYGTASAVVSWNIRQGHFKGIAVARIADSLTVSATRIALGITTSLGAWGLLVGTVVAQALSTVLQARIAKPTLAASICSRKRRIGWAIRRFRKFPLFSLPAGFIDSLAWQLPVFLLAPALGLAAVGLLTFSQRIVRIPLDALAHAFGEVLRQKVARAMVERGECRREYRDALVTLLVFSVPMYAAVALAGPWLFEVVFGSEWRVAGEIARVLSPMYCIQFAAVPLASVLVVAERQKTILAIQSVAVLAVAGVVALALKAATDVVAVAAALSALYVAKHTVELILSFRASGPNITAGAA